MLKKIKNHIRTPFFKWNIAAILIISLAAGHFIVTHGRKYELKQWLRMADYYYSVGYSMMIALILMLCIYTISWWMNIKYRAHGQLLQWLVFQLLYGVVLVLLIELLLATVLFWLKGYWIGNTSFFRKLLLPIVQFIISVNFGYMIVFLIKAPKIKYKVRYLPNVPNDALLATDLVDSPPALIYIDDIGIWQLSTDGEKTPWLDTLESAQEQFGKAICFRGQRHWVVFAHAIADYDKPKGKRQVIIYLKVEAPFELETSRRSTPHFKKWYDGYVDAQK